MTRKKCADVPEEVAEPEKVDEEPVNVPKPEKVDSEIPDQEKSPPSLARKS